MKTQHLIGIYGNLILATIYHTSNSPIAAAAFFVLAAVLTIAYVTTKL